MVHTASTKEISIGHDKISPKTPAPAATIIVGATHGIKQLVKDFGGNSDQVFRSARLPLSLPSGLAETIPLKRYVMLLEEAAAETKIKILALSLAAVLTLACWGRSAMC